MENEIEENLEIENPEMEEQNYENIYENSIVDNDKSENTDSQVQDNKLLQENIVLENRVKNNANEEITENKTLENTIVDTTANEQLTQIHEDLGFICSFLILFSLVIVFRYIYKFFNIFF